MTTTQHAVSSDPAVNELRVVLGVDTHRDAHVAAILTVQGEVLGCASFPATAVGYAQLPYWAAGFGTVFAAGIEGTGSYGAALTRHVRAAGITVIEVNRPDRALRRRHGKSDTVAQIVIDPRRVTPRRGSAQVPWRQW